MLKTRLFSEGHLGCQHWPFTKVPNGLESILDSGAGRNEMTHLLSNPLGACPGGHLGLQTAVSRPGSVFLGAVGGRLRTPQRIREYPLTSGAGRNQNLIYSLIRWGVARDATASLTALASPGVLGARSWCFRGFRQKVRKGDPKKDHRLEGEADLSNPRGQSPRGSRSRSGVSLASTGRAKVVRVHPPTQGEQRLAQGWTLLRA